MSVLPCGATNWWVGLSVAMGKGTSVFLCFVRAVLTENILITHHTDFILSRRHKHESSTLGTEQNLSRPCRIRPHSCLLVFLMLCHCPLPPPPLTCSLSVPHSTVISRHPFSGIAWSHCWAIDGKTIMVRLEESWLQQAFLYKFREIHFIGDL